MEEPANCIGLIKAIGAHGPGLWFVAAIHECDSRGDEYTYDTPGTPYIKPLPRSEVEESCKGLEPYVIVEVPT